MSKPRNRRWVCDLCESSALAPARVRMVDVRRWCLPCSEKHGVLVPRSCPALERERDRKRQAKARKRKQKQERAKVAAITFGTVGRVHVPTEFERILEVPSASKAVAYGRPTLALVQRSAPPSIVGKASWTSRVVTLYTWPGLHDYEILATLAHELAHLSTATTSGHDQRWRASFLEIVEDAFPGICVETPRRRSYHALDYEVEGAISRWLYCNLDDGLEARS